MVYGAVRKFYSKQLPYCKRTGGKISAQPHTTLCIQFLERENNDKNNTLPLKKQICLTIVWGCAEILPSMLQLRQGYCDKYDCSNVSCHDNFETPPNLEFPKVLLVIHTYTGSYSVMTRLLLVVISAILELSAVFLNVRLLLFCFKDEKRYKFLQKGRVLVILQFVCQVTILVADAIEWWNGFKVQLSESCDVPRVLSISLMFFQPCNLIAIMTISCSCEDNATQKTQELSSKLRIGAALTLGFIGSCLIWWNGCVNDGYSSQFALKFIFVVTTTYVVSQFGVALIGDKGLHQEEPLTDATSEEKANALSMWTKGRRPLFMTALMLLFLIIILSGKPSSGSLLCRHDSDEETLCTELVYSFITKFAVGIFLPMTLYDLIDSSYEGNKVKTLTLNVI